MNRFEEAAACKRRLQLAAARDNSPRRYRTIREQRKGKARTSTIAYRGAGELRAIEAARAAIAQREGREVRDS